MPEPDPPAIMRHQVLADSTGRRRRRLAITGRVATTALGLWLLVLILGGLGLHPLAGLPIVGDLGARETEPPLLPKRVQAAVARHTSGVPATVSLQAPVRSVPVPSRTPAVTAPRARGRTTPATSPGRTWTTPGRAAPAPSGPKTNPSTTAPGQTRNPPGQTRNPTGQTKTGPGPPTSTPGTTSGANPNGKLRRGNGTVTTP